MLLSREEALHVLGPYFHIKHDKLSRSSGSRLRREFGESGVVIYGEMRDERERGTSLELRVVDGSRRQLTSVIVPRVTALNSDELGNVEVFGRVCTCWQMRVRLHATGWLSVTTEEIRSS